MAAQPLLIAGGWRPASELPATFRAEDPATGKAIGAEYPVNGAADVAAAVAAAVAVADELARTPPERIAAFLPELDKIMDAGLVTLEKIRVIRFRQRESE